ARGVERQRRWHSGGRHGHQQRLDAFDAAGGAQVVGGGQLRQGDAVGGGYRGQGILRLDAMVAPRVAPGLGNRGDALLKQGGRARRQVKIEGGGGRRDQAQQAGIQRHQLIDRRLHDIGR